MIERMTLGEFLKGRSLWGAVAEIKSFPFLEGDLVKVMDSTLRVSYGRRIMFSAMEDLELEEIAQQLVMLHGSKWLALSTVPEELNLAGDYVITRKGSVNKDGLREGNSLNERQTVAYNEDDLTTESAEKGTTGETTTDSQKSDSEESRISYTSYFNNLQNADRLSILESVLKDAAKILTITVY